MKLNYASFVFMTLGPTRPSPAFSIPSIIAIVCAIGSFPVGAPLGLILAIVAIIAGAIGAVIALAPNRRGGLLSLLAIAGGLLGLVAVIFKIIF